jgi:hypothetical protein
VSADDRVAGPDISLAMEYLATVKEATELMKDNFHDEPIDSFSQFVDVEVLANEKVCACALCFIATYCWVL